MSLRRRRPARSIARPGAVRPPTAMEGCMTITMRTIGGAIRRLRRPARGASPCRRRRPGRGRTCRTSRTEIAALLRAAGEAGGAGRRQHLYASRSCSSSRIAAVRRSVLPPLLRRRLASGRPRERVQNSLGSGVIVRADGLIVTNSPRHREAPRRSRSCSRDRPRIRRRHSVTMDEQTDLAVLKIDPAARRCRSSSSATPTRSRSAIWCSRSAIRSASARR